MNDMLRACSGYIGSPLGAFTATIVGTLSASIGDRRINGRQPLVHSLLNDGRNKDSIHSQDYARSLFKIENEFNRALLCSFYTSCVTQFSSTTHLRTLTRNPLRMGIGVIVSSIYSSYRGSKSVG